jgi:hypothetical protein
MKSHTELVDKVRRLLLNYPPRDDKEFVEQFSQYLPDINQHLQFRTFRAIDFLSDDYYEEYKTPLAIFHLQRLESIINSDELKNVEKRRQITELLTTGMINSQPIKEMTEYYDDCWGAIKGITQFYYQAKADPDQVNVWEPILNGSLISQDELDSFNYRLPQKLIKDFAQLIQAIGEIDADAVTLLQNCIEDIDGNTQSKVEFIIKLLGMLLVSGSQNVFSIQDQEYAQIEEQENKHIQNLYNFYINDSDKNYQQKAHFTQLCWAMIYDEKFVLPTYWPELPELSQNQLYFLHRDIKYLFVKDDLKNARTKALGRLEHIAGLIQDLSTYCGCELPIANARPPAGISNRDKFFHKFYTAPQVQTLYPWENLLAPLELQKKRSRTLNIKDMANLMSAGLALGEGTVASFGSYQMLMSVNPALAIAVSAPTLAGSAGCNYAIVIEDTEKTIDALSNGLDHLHTNSEHEKLGVKRKILLWLLSFIPSFISGACYGALGGLSAVSTVTVILSFAGLSMIPVVGWIIFGVIALVTFVTVFSILFELTREAIANTTWTDIQEYFYKRFYWPSTGTKTDKTLAFFNNFFNALCLTVAMVLISGLLFLTSLKLFATSLTTAFMQFTWGGAAADKLASTLSYINSSLWLYFNFKKGSNLFDLLYPRGAAKIVPYIIETALRTSLLIVPAIIVFLVNPIIWLFSSELSNKCANMFDKILDAMAPNWSSNFLNKHLPGRTHSGVGEMADKHRPIQISGGVIKSTLALCKLLPYIPEVSLRFGLGIVYKALWPVRKVVRTVHNYAYKKSESYRTGIDTLSFIKPRYQESHIGEIIVPKATHYVVNKLFVAAKWVQRKIHGWFSVKVKATSPVESDNVAKAREHQGNTAAVVVAANSLGQYETFAQGGSGELPGFLKDSTDSTKEFMAGAPQFVCSEALNDGACKAMINRKEYIPLEIMRKHKNIPMIAQSLVAKYKTREAKPTTEPRLTRSFL